MPQYLIERNIPGAGKLTSAELKAISQKSCSVLNQLGPQIQWVHSYVTGDQCLPRAERRDGAGARPPRRVPRQPGVRDQDRDRPDNSGVAPARAHNLRRAAPSNMP
jgi:hypothetical protein